MVLEGLKEVTAEMPAVPIDLKFLFTKLAILEVVHVMTSAKLFE